MTSIEFTYPYLLLVAIPLIGLSLIPYFKVSKKYRKTRNRIVSLVLHCLTIVLVTIALSGVTFVTSISNTANELILVVDMSDTQNETADNRNDFIRGVLRESIYRNFTVGVVTFGLDQVYAVPLTTNINSVYDGYLKAELPDTSATDIESALEYARGLFNHPESGKILLITDGKETDGNVISSSAAGSIIAQGTKLDTVFVSSDYKQDEYQLLSVDTPSVQIKKGVEYTIDVNVFSNKEGAVRINLYDNGEHVAVGSENDKTYEYAANLSVGTQVIPITYMFQEKGMHELKVELVPAADNGASDEFESNNTYYTYLDIKVSSVLVIETFDGNSEALKDVLNDTEMLGEDETYDVSIFNLREDRVTHYLGATNEAGKVPVSVDDFRKYDQVILNNVSNSDLVKREIPLDKLLYSYVYEYGGGMLTVGGSDPSDIDKKPYAYNESDMRGTDFQKMLPVEAIKYTPSAGVFIIVDVSGSMSEEANGHSRLYWAQFGARACVDALEDRDKIGIMTLGSTYSDVLPLTPRTEKNKILKAIDGIEEAHSGTVFTPSVMHAAEQLRAAKMEKNHIIIVSDGEIGAEEGAACAEYAKQCYEDEKLNLTISIVLIGSNGGDVTKNIVCATREEGWINKINNKEKGCGYYPLNSGNSASIYTVLTEDLNVEAIKEVNYKDFKPVVFNRLSPVVQGVEITGSSVNATLSGYYGVKKRNLDSVDLVLTSEYQVPIYARWDYGRGSVGSFMCDLNGGSWSGEFMSSDAGKQLIYNMIDDLAATADIHPQDINVSLSGKNYSNHLTCPTALEEGETVRGIIHTPDGDSISLNELGEYDGCIVKRALNEGNKYSICEFLIMKGGIYTIEIQKLNAEGNPVSTAVVYKEFSYSKEYDMEYGKTVGEIKDLLSNLARIGGGSDLDEKSNVSDIFKGFETELKRVFDPRLILIVVAAVLFLLDVAVRKFKFKWIHEIVRERKEKAKGGQLRKEGRHEEDN